MPIDLRSYGLSVDPFILQPTLKVTTWAGRSWERDLLNDIVHTPLATDIGTSEFTVVHGDYGAGKSHALRYFNHLINEVDSAEFRSLAVYVPTIKMDSRTTFIRLYREIIEIIGERRLKSLADDLWKRFVSAKDAVRQDVVPANGESDLSEAISNTYLEREVLQSIPGPDLPMFQLLLSLAEGEESAISYLKGSGNAPVATGLSGRVNSDFDAAKTLGALFRVLTLSVNGQPPVCPATYLFLDEVESILDDRQTDLVQFFQGIRNLINELPYNFCLLMSFTADAAMVEAVLPRGILERMTRPGYVELASLTPDHAEDFIRGLFDQHRPEGFTHNNPYHPFSEESIELALERLAQITPRQLFRILNSVLVRAIQREGLQGGEEISADMADSILSAGGYR